MKNFVNSRHPIRRTESFKFAFKGIGHALVNEPNFRIQVGIVIVALIGGFYFGISHIEWALLVITMGILLVAEMVNTVVEEFIDNLIPEFHNGAQIIKDLSAGAVLIAALMALFILVFTFGPRIIILF